MTAPLRPTLSELQQFANLLKPDSELSPNQPVNSEEFIGNLDYHGIALLAQTNAKFPDNLAHALNQRRAMMVANEVLKQKALIKLFDAFKDAGLTRIVLFKGSALAYDIYPQAWLRPRSDSDCLIDKHDLNRFTQVFYDMGYQKLFAIEGKHIHYQSTFSKALVGQSAINIDLHWQISNRKTLACAFKVDELQQSGSVVAELGGSITIPNRVDSLLIASLHRLGHHLHEERLIWLYDIHLLAERLDAVAWQHLCDKAEAKQLAGITLDALRLCETVLQTPIPDLARATLARLAQKAEPSQLFLNRDLSEWTYFWNDLKALPGTREKLSAVLENLVPPPDYIRQQMGTKSALWGYVKRTLRGIKRLATS